MAIEGRHLFYEIVSDPDNIKKEHIDCVRELVGTVVSKHFPANYNADFIDEFTSELFIKLLPTLGSWIPDPKVHYGNYFYTTIKNTCFNHLSKEYRYGLDLFSVSDAPSSEAHPEISMDSYILGKYGSALLGECFAVVEECDIDAMLDFLNKGLYN